MTMGTKLLMEILSVAMTAIASIGYTLLRVTGPTKSARISLPLGMSLLTSLPMDTSLHTSLPMGTSLGLPMGTSLHTSLPMGTSLGLPMGTSLHTSLPTRIVTRLPLVTRSADTTATASTGSIIPCVTVPILPAPTNLMDTLELTRLLPTMTMGTKLLMEILSVAMTAIASIGYTLLRVTGPTKSARISLPLGISLPTSLPMDTSLHTSL
eukprot:95540_1